MIKHESLIRKESSNGKSIAVFNLASLFYTYSVQSLPCFHEPDARMVEIGERSTIWVSAEARGMVAGLMERSEKPGDDPIFGDGISPA